MQEFLGKNDKILLILQQLNKKDLKMEFKFSLKIDKDIVSTIFSTIKVVLWSMFI